jgi:hypothetical protein
MTPRNAASELKRVKQVSTSRPDWDYAILTPPKSVIASLQRAFPFPKTCTKACTKLVTLLPKVKIDARTGLGFPMVNVDGFRTINAFVISDPILSSLQRGFTLELSFAPKPFVLGVGVVGETSFYFNAETYFDPGTLTHGLHRCESSDFTTVGGLPKLGGVDLTHVLRSPVLGPFVRASAFNEDNVAHSVQVIAYLST